MMINIMMINVMMINVMVIKNMVINVIVINVMVTKNMVIKLTIVVPKKVKADVGSTCLESPFAEGDLWSTSDGKLSAIFKMV